ncbi:MAG: hydroxymethylbilane synthase [Xanthomonadales bacterium]|nr:Porphobilinogen deaminase [Xanthomonadales bacterium]MCC6594565.1 hydroxymethylbilane synthase [Xanthomonadales bacterium]MCE7931011.1 hydroxymethylbilane synthase [Xanthomonadales bacterium PRO6]
MPLRIATRKSTLALWQTEHVAARLRALDPQLQVELVPLSTRGDEVLDRSLAAIGGKGLFLKELELALERGEADIAVHSLKDVPMELEPGFELAAILEREDPADAFVSNHFEDLDALPQDAIVGTSSLRRHAQLIARRPDLVVRDLRGNVNTRLARLDAGDYDAIILAVAGLRRLGFDARIRSRLCAPDWLPAAAQGAICIEARAGDHAIIERVRALHDAATATRIRAERALNQHLGGSCQVPIAALANLAGAGLHLQGLVGHATSGRLVRAEEHGETVEPEALGRRVAQALLDAGAGELLQGVCR